jgi:hypothetical protein
MYAYQMFQWINRERTMVAASTMRYATVSACEKDAREQLHIYLPGTVCEIVEDDGAFVSNGPVVKRIGN